MGVGVFIHHIGTFLLLAATVLLIVTSISAPVVNEISLLKVNLKGGDVYFGTFGFCETFDDGRSDECSHSHVGYNPAQFINRIDSSVDYGTGTEDTTKALTRVMVLHPVGAGLCFISFLLCLGTGIVGSFIASLIAVLAFIVTAVAVICDFVSFSLIKHKINDDSSSDISAKYGPAIWTALAAACAALIAAVLVFVTCCAGRVKDKRYDRSRRVKGWNDEIPHGA